MKKQACLDIQPAICEANIKVKFVENVYMFATKYITSTTVQLLQVVINKIFEKVRRQIKALNLISLTRKKTKCILKSGSKSETDLRKK